MEMTLLPTMALPFAGYKSRGDRLEIITSRNGTSWIFLAFERLGKPPNNHRKRSLMDLVLIAVESTPRFRLGTVSSCGTRGG
jgi:hypothetical protein